MKRFISEQAGKFLLALALVWVGASAVLCPEHRAAFEKEAAVKDYERKVQVQFNPQELAPREAVFPDRADYRGTDRPVFNHPEKKEDPFRGLDLPPVTRAVVTAPPQLLTAPGPSLQGAEKFPRWEKDMPPIYVPQPVDPKKAGGPPADPARKADADPAKKSAPDITKAAPPLETPKKAPADPAKNADADAPKKAGPSPSKKGGDTKKAGEEIMQ
jgi:hypothetical protein